MIKVLHYVESLDKTAGGTAAYIKLLSEELKHLVNMLVVSVHSENPIQLGAIPVYLFEGGLKKWFKLKQEFIQILKKEQPDLVHINGIWTPQNWLFQKEAQRLGIKIVLSPHGMLEPYILNRNPLKKKMALALYQSKALKMANFLHATASSELSQIRKLGFSQKAAIIANGIDLSEILPKKMWKGKEEEKQILFLSRVHPKKGIELFIEAVTHLKSRNFKVIIAGEGEKNYISELKKLAEQNGVSKLFEFSGGVYGKEKWELYKSSDLFVLPTYSENFGIVIAEALATGMPVITTTGTPWEELQSRNCGWWISLSAQKLGEVLETALNESAEDVRKMAENAQKLVREKYDIKSVAQDMSLFYNWALNTNLSQPTFVKD